ncbi:hypothetical protein R1flu_005190 [Riccia fluitans]|uniref:Transposase n=1 Tax=Riccia fluitans TaxID=41844 RepID=A0ABD1YSZ7_9MARC
MVTLTRKETCSSWKIDTQALELALKILEDKGLTIGEVIHDDNAQVDAILKDHNIMSQKDLWHKFEGVLPGAQSATVRIQIATRATGVGSSQVTRGRCKYGNPETTVVEVSQIGSPRHSVQAEVMDLHVCEECRLEDDATQELLTMDIHNAADHWAGDHTTCSYLPGMRKYVVENWTCGKEAKYPKGGETHKAVKEFLKKYIMETKMKCYIRARENFISETFPSVINKFAMKHIHFDASHTARLACAAMDWNKNIRRDVRATYQHASNDTAVRQRAKTNRVLVERTSHWKKALAATVFS